MSILPSKLNAFLYSSIKTFVLFYLIYQLGFLKGSIFFFLLSKTYTFLMNFIFKFERCSFTDMMFVNDANSVFNMNVGAIFNLETLNNVENIKHILISKLFKKIPKLSSKVVFYLGEYFFDNSKKYTEEELKKQFKEIELSRTELKSYCEIEMSKNIDIFNEIGLEFHIIRYKKDGKKSICQIDQNSEGAILMKLNHMISDGMGVVNMIGFIDDHFSINKFPRLLRREKVGFLKNLLNEIYLFILAFTYGFFIFFEVAKEGKPELFSSTEVNGENFDNRNMVLSNLISIDLNELKEYSKKEKISINEIVVDSIYRAMFINYPNAKKISGMIPINYNALVENINNFHIKNSSSGIRFTVDSPYNEVNTRNKIRKFVKSNIILSKTFKSIFKFISEILSIRYIYPIKKETATDICISNVPCQEDYMSIGGNKILDTFPVGEPNTFLYEFLIGSYAGKLYISFSTKKKFGGNIDKIIKDINEELLKKLNKKL